MKNKKVEFAQDERQQAITNKAMAAAFVFLLLCLFAATIYRIVTTDNVGWDLFAILGGCAVILIARRIMGDIEEPKDVYNRPLPLGNSKQDKWVRKKNYAKSSGIFALTFAVMDILLIGFGKESVTDYEVAEILFPTLNKTTTIAVTAVIAFVSMFAVSYIFDYLVGEHKVKKYNQMLKELDEE